jgi:hypothetical protein
VAVAIELKPTKNITKEKLMTKFKYNHQQNTLFYQEETLNPKI